MYMNVNTAEIHVYLSLYDVTTLYFNSVWAKRYFLSCKLILFALLTALS